MNCYFIICPCFISGNQMQKPCFFYGLNKFFLSALGVYCILDVIVETINSSLGLEKYNALTKKYIRELIFYSFLGKGAAHMKFVWKKVSSCLMQCFHILRKGVVFLKKGVCIRLQSLILSNRNEPEPLLIQ